MSPARETAALVALLRLSRRPWPEQADVVERTGALAVLEAQLAGEGGQATLLPEAPEPLLAQAEADIDGWQAEGFALVTVVDGAYPENLRTVHDRPPLLFVRGALGRRDSRSIAIIGARRATGAGRTAAAGIADALTRAGYVVVSGLAAGIDTAAHEATLAAGGRTIAVVGTGLRHCYPPQNAELQRRVAAAGAVVSQFWPEAGPARTNFPLRNGVMSGLALGTVVVEASFRSGARLQARLALAHGRPVFLWRSLLDEAWAREFAQRPGVYVVDEPEQIVRTVERLNAVDELVE